MQQGKSGVVAKGSFLMGLLTEEPKGLLQPVNQDVFGWCSRLKCVLGREGHQLGSAQQDICREEEGTGFDWADTWYLLA